MAKLLPWPLKHQRESAIDAARRQKEASQAGAVHAEAIESDIRQMAAENHFGQLIAAQIMRGYRREGEP